MDTAGRSRRAFLRKAAAASAGGAICSWGTGPGEGKGGRLASGKDVPWLMQVQQCNEEGAPRALRPLLADAQNEPIQSLSAWKKKRAVIRERWLDFIGPLDPNPNPPNLEVIKTDHPVGVIRQLVEYEGEPGMRVRGYLIRPRQASEPRPGVVVLHSTVDHTIRQPAGVEGVPQKAFGLRLAQMGLVTFSPECFLWQGPEHRSYEEQAARFQRRHPASKGMAKMLFDASRGLDVLEHLGQVDAGRMGVIGHSLGAKEALYLAVFDERVRAAVSSEGGIGTSFSNWDAPWYLGEGIKGFGHDHHELLSLVAPRPFLLIGGGAADGEQSCPYVEAALPVYGLHDGTPRRIGLLNHGQGHAVPPVAEHRAYQWLLTYL